MRNAVALTVLAAVAAAVLLAHGGSAASGPTYNADVAPILDAKCASCHRLGGIAPFALTTAADAKAHAAGIVRMTQAGLMPPWMPGDDSAAIVGRDVRRLTSSELATLSQWAAAGATGRQPGRPPLQAVDRRRPDRPGHDARARTGQAVHPARGQRGDRRLPLLRARSEAQAERVRHGRPDQAPAHGHRPPRDPLRGRRRAGDRRGPPERSDWRQGLDVLRRSRPAARPGELGLADAARPAAVDRRVGARPLDERAAERHRRAGAQGREDHHAGALQPDRRVRPGPNARRAAHPPRHDAADAAPDAADRRTGRAAVPRRGHRVRSAAASKRSRTRSTSTASRTQPSRRRCCGSAARRSTTIRNRSATAPRSERHAIAR